MTGPAPARPAGRWLLSVVLLAEALLVASPLVAVSSWWIGAQLVGKYVAQVRMTDVLVMAGAVLAPSFLVLLLLVAALGAPAGRHRLLALVLQPAVAAMALLPMLQPVATLGRLPLWRWAPLVLASAAVLLLAITWTRPRPDRGGVVAARIVGLVAVGALAAGIAVGATSTRLPADPLLLLAGPPVDGDAAPRPVTAARPPQNPALAPDPFNSIHNDSWATDAYAVPGPTDPLEAPTDSLFTGGDCATLTFDAAGRLLTLCSSLTTVTAWAVDPASMQPIASRAVSTRPPSLTDFSGGGYVVLDAAGRLITPTRDGVLRALRLADGDAGAQFVDDGSWDVSGVLQPDEGVTSVIPDWGGRLWFVGARGTVGVVDPTDGAVRATRLGEESIENSFAVAEDAVYVVTGAALYRLWAGAGGDPAVVWRQAYDAGVAQKPGQTSRASGTTPTLLDGGRLVAITDNAEPRMNVVVMRTEPASPQRVLCSVPVFAPGESATENSLVAVGRSLFVENNFGYRPAFTSVTGGGSVAPGVARVDVDPVGGSCAVAWENDEVHVPSLVSKASAADGLFYTWTKQPRPLGPDVWSATALDLATGRLAWSRPMGGGTPYNNHYASVAIGPDGSLYYGTAAGIAVLRSAP